MTLYSVCKKRKKLNKWILLLFRLFVLITGGIKLCQHEKKHGRSGWLPGSRYLLTTQHQDSACEPTVKQTISKEINTSTGRPLPEKLAHLGKIIQPGDSARAYANRTPKIFILQC